MEENIKKCPFCSMTLDEKSILYKGYYVCSSCANTVQDSQNAEIIRRYSNYIHNLEFKRADALRNTMLDEASLDVNELQLFTFYSSILDLFLTKDPSKIIKFLNDSTVTDIGVVIEVLHFLSSISVYIEKLGPYILKYVSMQEKYVTQVSNPELEVALIEVKKRYFKSIANKSNFIQEHYKYQKLNLTEIIELVNSEDPSNIAALYAILDEVALRNYSADEINHYLLTCDHALQLYYDKTKRKMSDNYRAYYQKAKALRKKYALKNKHRYKWQDKVKKPFKKHLMNFLLSVLAIIGLFVVIILFV